MQLDYNLFRREVENKLPMNNRRVIKEVKMCNEKSHRKKKYVYILNKRILCVFFHPRPMKYFTAFFAGGQTREIKISCSRRMG